MPLHIALLEPRTPNVVGGVARACADVDASLHLVGPVPFGADDAALRRAGPKAWDQLDLWVHPGWRDFRDAMSRERCLYFDAAADRPASEAPFRPNSVLVLGDEAGALPERIRDKYPDRVFRLDIGKGTLADAISRLLAVAAKPGTEAPPRRSRSRRR